MDEPVRRRPRLRAFVLGGAVGASAAAAALRRARRRRQRQKPAGLAAFESALATGSCSIGSGASAVAAKHAVGALDGEEVHVRVADAERAAEQPRAAREEQVAIR